jgi:hypothetical protein
MGLLTSIAFVFTSLTSDADTIPFQLDSIEIKTFHTKVMIKTHPNAAYLFFAPHGDEHDGPKAIAMLHDSIKYNYIYLKNNTGRRELYGTMKGISFLADPNRLFTKAGIATQLNRNKLLKNYQPLKDSLNKFSALILDLLSKYAVPNKYIIALHNNRDASKSTSNTDLTILKEKKDGEFVKICMNDKTKNRPADPDNYLYLSEKSDFEALCAMKLNAGLMPKANYAKSIPKNNGSLSYYASIHDIPYINIEIQHGATAIHFRYLITVINYLHSVTKKVL